MDKETLDSITTGYLTCAAWADAPENSLARFPNAEKAKARKVCEEFANSCGPLFDQAISQYGYTAERFGHDFWLTRCGHGTGYWDRNELEVPPCADVTFIDRDGKEYHADQGATLGKALSAAAYGTNARIGRFAYPTLTAIGSWLYFEFERTAP